MAEPDENRTAPETAFVPVSGDNAVKGWAEEPVNEIVKTAREAKQDYGKNLADEKRGTWLVAGVGVGIGSAALLAALLFANRDRERKL